jgi:phytoene dehydrogenase-like protein
MSRAAAGWEVDFFEATNSPGGWVQAMRSDGYAIDTGASAVGSTRVGEVFMRKDGRDA